MRFWRDPYPVSVVLERQIQNCPWKNPQASGWCEDVSISQSLDVIRSGCIE